MKKKIALKLENIKNHLQHHLHREKVIGHLKTHQIKLTYALSIIAFIAVFCVSWNFYQQIQSKKYSAILHQVMIDEQKGESDKAMASLKKIYESHAPAGVKQIASIKYAAQILQTQKLEKAVEIYLEISRNRSFDPYIRDYSGLMALKILVSENTKEGQEKITAKIISLEKELEKNSKVLKNYIIEQKGIFELNSGNYEEASKAFKSISDDSKTSEMLKKRVLEMLAICEAHLGDKQENAKK
jgi:hypothetical protein